MGRTIGKSAIEVMRKRFPKKASEIETYADAFDVLAEEVNNGSSGGGDEYETVAEIEIGAMERGAAQGFPVDWWYDAVATTPPAMREGETYYLNDADHPSDSVVVLTEPIVTLLLFNCKVEDNTFVPIETEEPSYVIIDDGNEYTGVVCSEDISNNTVKILKTVSGGETITVDSELSSTSENPVQNKVITAALANAGGVKMIHATVVSPETEGGDTTLEIEETDEECRAMVTSGKPVILEVMFPIDELGIPLPVYGLMTSSNYEPSENLWSAIFCVVLGYNSTNIQAYEILLVSPVDGIRGTVTPRAYKMLPNFSDADAGKVLSVDSNGELEWVTPT